MNYSEPYVPQMLSLASLQPSEKVFDLGSGDARIVITAARDFLAVATGIEARDDLAIESRRKIEELGLSDRVKILHRNWTKVSLRAADVVACYLSTYSIDLLRSKLRKELKPGARLVNFSFPISGWRVSEEIEVIPKGWKTTRPIYLYTMPARKDRPPRREAHTRAR